MNNYPKINGLVISAGFSSRMQELKPLMDYQGKPFLGGILLKLSLICDSLLVVTGFESQRIKQETQNFLGLQIHNINSKVNWCYNKDYKQGMFSSLQAGVKELNGDTWTLYHLVDQPGLSEEFYTEFQNQLDDNYDWIQPCYQSKNGHPIFFSPIITKLISDADPQNSLRDLNKQETIQKKIWECSFAEVLQDFDSPEDVE